MTYSIADVEALAEKYDDLEGYRVWSELTYSSTQAEDEEGNVVVKFVRVDSHGGEGQGDEAWVVFKVNDSDQLFMKTGYYASHYGFDWDGDISEVEAYEKTVTDYRPI